MYVLYAVIKIIQFPTICQCQNQVGPKNTFKHVQVIFDSDFTCKRSFKSLK